MAGKYLQAFFQTGLPELLPAVLHLLESQVSLQQHRQFETSSFERAPELRSFAGLPPLLSAVSQFPYRVRYRSTLKARACLRHRSVAGRDGRRYASK